MSKQNKPKRVTYKSKVNILAEEYGRLYLVATHGSDATEKRICSIMRDAISLKENTIKLPDTPPLENLASDVLACKCWFGFSLWYAESEVAYRHFFETVKKEDKLKADAIQHYTVARDRLSTLANGLGMTMKHGTFYITPPKRVK